MGFASLKEAFRELFKGTSGTTAAPLTTDYLVIAQTASGKNPRVSLVSDVLALVDGAIVGLTSSAAELNILDGVTATFTEINKVAGVTAGTAAASKAAVLGADKNLDTLAIADGGLKLGAGAGTAVAATAAELNKVDGIPATAYIVQHQELTFTETSGAGTYTGTMALPAGARIIDIGCDGQVLWNSAGACALIVGDAGTADGFFTSTDLKATDLLAGEINNLEHPGGKAGAFIASEQRNLYTAAARDIIAVVTQASGTGTAGRTRVYVTYAVPTAVAAVKV
jgi:hypothetical protein